MQRSSPATAMAAGLRPERRWKRAVTRPGSGLPFITHALSVGFCSPPSTRNKRFADSTRTEHADGLACGQLKNERPDNWLRLVGIAQHHAGGFKNSSLTIRCRGSGLCGRGHAVAPGLASS